MKRFTFLTLLFTALLLSNTCNTAQADFIIDNFRILDDIGGSATSIGGSGITVAVSANFAPSNNPNGTSTVVADDDNDRYFFQAFNAGDTLVISYDFDGIFNDLQSVSGNQLSTLPANFFGDFTTTIDTGVETLVFDDNVPSVLAPPIDIDDATELTFTFTYNGGSPVGFGVGTFGGTVNPLFATPEPTAFLMLGTAGLIVLFPRRRRS